MGHKERLPVRTTALHNNIMQGLEYSENVGLNYLMEEEPFSMRVLNHYRTVAFIREDNIPDMYSGSGLGLGLGLCLGLRHLAVKGPSGLSDTACTHID